MYDDEYDPVFDRLDAMHYAQEPEPPECIDCNDSGCRCCRPRGRQLRRMRHRQWQRRDRASRSGVGMIAATFGVPVDLLGPPF